MPDAAMPPFVRLDGRASTLVIALAGGIAVPVWWGPQLRGEADLAALAALVSRGEAPASPTAEVPLALTPQAGQGWQGRPGLMAHRGGRGWASLALVETVALAPGLAVLTARDTANGLVLVHDLRLDPAGDVLVAATRLTNAGDTPLVVEALAAPVLPLPDFVTDIIGFEGHWANEFQTRRWPRTMGSWVRENRRGRTSHDAFPGLIACEATASEAQGLAWGFHLGWSGNHRLGVEMLGDGRGLVMMEELLLPGEIILAPGQSLESPPLFAGVSGAGLSGLSQAFHNHLRARPEHARLRARPRPVHYNSWEAVYFDHDPAVLADLAGRAAAIGAERFVLDDGWFAGRRSDRAGLGDWRADDGVYPNGLGPLVARVNTLGMEFGLWIEPEMVNPDSDLYRAQPDWVLATPPAPQLDFRHQLVLDFGRAEVRAHMLAAIDNLLSAHPIGYLKWDMNRDINHPGGADGRAGVHAHVKGVYAVLDALRGAHPGVEIESCASGGGRADFGILARTDRIWASDSNDALDRLAIQRGFSHFFPAEVMGAHVGPARCHITGRRLSMPLRVATALFGHMGMELDLRAVSPAEIADLAAGVALHKAHRSLIHGGDLVRIDAGAGASSFAIVADDRGAALLSWTSVDGGISTFPRRLRLSGLDPAAAYRVALVWPPRFTGFSASRLCGDTLAHAGIALPRCPPATGLIFHLARQETPGRTASGDT